MNAEQFYEIYKKSSGVTIDSRKIQNDEIFFAFSGENFNAATLAQDAVAKGALAAIVEQEAYQDKDKNIFYVPSTLGFLQELAKIHRSKISIPIIALTGSNGKTTTKELMSCVLAEKFSVQYTYGNLNNHIGVPLTLLSIKPSHEIAVVEMGANHQKEIELLCEIAKPDFGYITNFGKAHLEGFGGFEGVIKGKSELYNYLFKDGKTVVVNEADEIQAEKTAGYQKKITFGTADSQYHFSPLQKEQFIGLNIGDAEMVSNLTGNYNFTNLCVAAALGLYFNVEIQQIKHAIENYFPTNMRSQILEKDGKVLVLDTYNANPSSMAVSLQNFSTFSGTKAVVLGDMLELGDASLEEHQNILKSAKAIGFEQVITVGKNFQNAGSELSFENTSALIGYLSVHKINSKNILLKGSRGIALEKVLDFI